MMSAAQFELARERLVRQFVCGQARVLTLKADVFGSGLVGGVAVLVQLVGQDEPGGVVRGVFLGGLQQGQHFRTRWSRTGSARHPELLSWACEQVADPTPD